MSGRLFPLSINDIFSWEIFEKLPKIGDTEILLISNQIKMYKPFSAWHVVPYGVQPHTKRYRMMRAILEDDINEIKNCIDDGYNINGQLDLKYGFTPLGLAATLNRHAIIEYLYFRGADVDFQDRNGNTPLMHAVKNWQFEAIKSLQSCGCNLDKKDLHGYTALDKAKQKNLNALVNFLMDSKNKEKQNKQYPKFTLKMKFEELCSDITSQITEKKKNIFGKSILYPFNDLQGNYKLLMLSFDDQITIENKNNNK